MGHFCLSALEVDLEIFFTPQAQIGLRWLLIAKLGTQLVGVQLILLRCYPLEGQPENVEYTRALPNEHIIEF